MAALLLVLWGLVGHRFWLGADVSSLALRPGLRVVVAGDTLEPLGALQQAGLEWVRLRLWHGAGEYSWERMVPLARRARALGFKVVLAIHYSDTWADPAHQRMPEAWRGLPLSALEDSAGAYTRAVLERFAAAGVLPQMVQIGNEIDHGLLWEAGRFQGTVEASPGLVRLLSAALRAVQEAQDSVLTLLSVTPRGLPVLRALHQAGLEWDLVGVSYYPWWHGSLDSLAQCLVRIHRELHKPVLVLETAYPWTLNWADDTHNPVGLPRQLLPGFPATPEGQARFLEALLQVVQRTRGAVGVFYWEPVWLPARTPEEPGSPWENLALFDFQGHALPALWVFSRMAGPGAQ